MTHESSAVVVDIAKELIALARRLEPDWKKAYFRFFVDGLQLGSNGSYVSTTGVTIIDPFKNSDFFSKMNAQGTELIRLLAKDHFVFLLVVDPK